MIKTISARQLLLTFVFLSGLSAATYYFTGYAGKPRYMRYPGFGIALPAGYPIHGIDISRYQLVIDWEELSEMQVKNVKIGFSFIKATEGTDKTDVHFRDNWNSAKDNNIARGAYHFFIPAANGKVQADHFIETVRLEKGDLPLVLDVEQAGTLSIDSLQQQVAKWINVVEQFYKVKPIIYSNADFYRRYLSPRFDGYPLWVAHYLVKDRPDIERQWSFWQHNDGGRVNGVGTSVDFNVFNGDTAAFRKMLIP